MLSNQGLKLLHGFQEETSLKALDGLIEFAEAQGCEVMEELTDVISMFREHLRLSLKDARRGTRRALNGAAAGTAGGTRGGKRAPTAYHQFLSQETERLKAEQPDLVPAARRAEALRLWKEQKARNAAGPSQPALINNPVFDSTTADEKSDDEA